MKNEKKENISLLFGILIVAATALSIGLISIFSDFKETISNPFVIYSLFFIVLGIIQILRSVFSMKKLGIILFIVQIALSLSGIVFILVRIQVGVLSFYPVLLMTGVSIVCMFYDGNKIIKSKWLDIAQIVVPR